jgi:hypothetical protein
MKVAVIGSRDFNDYELVKETLKYYTITLLVSGGAKGADSFGERYANENNIETLIFKPDWDKHGKAAGMIRNTDIVNNADTIIAFWDGESKGTKDSITKAEKKGKNIIIVKTK